MQNIVYSLYIICLYNSYSKINVSGASSPAKHGDAYFSAVYGSIQVGGGPI